MRCGALRAFGGGNVNDCYLGALFGQVAMVGYMGCLIFAVNKKVLICG